MLYIWIFFPPLHLVAHYCCFGKTRSKLRCGGGEEEEEEEEEDDDDDGAGSEVATASNLELKAQE